MPAAFFWPMSTMSCLPRRHRAFRWSMAVLLGHHRDHDGGVVRAPRFVDGRRIGQRHFIEFADRIADEGPSLDGLEQGIGDGGRLAEPFEVPA